MSKLARLVSMVLVAALGVGAAALAAGKKQVVACTDKAGKITVQQPNGRCRQGQFVITLSGSAFKKGPGGVTFNGVTMRSGTLPNSLTINGTSFRTTGGSLTISGHDFGPPGASNLRGPTGPAGADGTDGTVAPGPAPAVNATAEAVGAGPKVLASVSFTNTDGKAHRLLITGGFNAVCNPCTLGTQVNYGIARGGAPIVKRQLPTMSPDTVNHASGTLSEIIVAPDVCNPCTYDLSATVPDGSAGGQTPPSIDASERRLGIVDLGPVAA